MPTWYETWRSLNQFVRWSSWKPPRSKWNQISDSIQTPTSASATSSAIAPAVNVSHGNSQTNSAPPSGIRIRAVVSQPIVSARRHEDDRDHRQARCDRERVGADEARLQPARAQARVAEGPCDLADSAADERPFDPAAEALRERDRRPVERVVVGFVEVELVLEHALREGVLRDAPAPGAVDHPRDRDSRQAEQEREQARERLLCIRRLRERARDRLQPVRDGVPERRELDPAADHGPP